MRLVSGAVSLSITASSTSAGDAPSVGDLDVPTARGTLSADAATRHATRPFENELR